MEVAQLQQDLANLAQETPGRRVDSMRQRAEAFGACRE